MIDILFGHYYTSPLYYPCPLFCPYLPRTKSSTNTLKAAVNLVMSVYKLIYCQFLINSSFNRMSQYPIVSIVKINQHIFTLSGEFFCNIQGKILSRRRRSGLCLFSQPYMNTFCRRLCPWRSQYTIISRSCNNLKL